MWIPAPAPSASKKRSSLPGRASERDASFSLERDRVLRHAAADDPHEPRPQHDRHLGTLTNFCYGTTARQGDERGFNVVVVGDLTATDDLELQEAELKILWKGFARVLSLGELLTELRSRE